MRTFATKQEQFLKRLKDTHRRQHIETAFLYFAAPVLRGAKPAVLMALQPHCLAEWQKRQNILRKATGLQTREIINRHHTVLLLIYDETAMRTLLRDPQTMALRKRYGYPAGYDPREMFSHLQSRFADSDFPHEIGIFLGYPAEDVWGFIINEGRNWVCCRYWKVYHDVERAQEMFRQIDEAHRYAIELLYRPMPIHITANLLKAV